MASNSRVFVSPGVYTSEVDLTFVAQSVGVTTLGLAGETLQGPAFEPVLISSFDEFMTYFGNPSPEKFGNGYPKYELPYVAQSYLKESNQLFVTRVLGLTGYNAGISFGIQTLGFIVGVNTNQTPTQSSGTMDFSSLSAVTGNTFHNDLVDKISTDSTSFENYVVQHYSGASLVNQDYFTVGFVPSSATSSLTGSDQTSPIGNITNAGWYEVYNDAVNHVYSYLFVYNSTSHHFDITRFTWNATMSEYDGRIVAIMRSRGYYNFQNLVYSVSGTTDVSITDINANMESNPFTEFQLNITGNGLNQYSFICSLNNTDTQYLSNVLGVGVYDKSYNQIPLYVQEIYSNLVFDLYSHGLIKGLYPTVVANVEGTNFLTEWAKPASPTVVSEVRGNKVDDLFDIVPISDGDAANTLYKVTIANIDINTGDFDILVRDFNDTDDNMVVLEKFSRCSMDPTVAGYVAAKVGTVDGQYNLISNYIMLNMADNAPSNSFPAGFKGFANYNDFDGKKAGDVLFKTSYLNSGDVAYTDMSGNPVYSNGDSYKKVSLGLSSQYSYKFDQDLFKYKGQNQGGSTLGFHLSANASGITDSNGNVLYQTTAYDLEGQTETSPGQNALMDKNYRKFTFAFGGGFDGWDVYRNVRTNSDEFIFNKADYISGNTNNGGVFSTTVGNSDYYAYWQAIQTFQNPEAVDINVFATPGLDWYNHESLTTLTIDMVETERADSVYLINSPGPVDFSGTTSASDISATLSGLAYDSNYSATYWPWIQVLDTINSVQVYIPPTAEVVRNIALTDNVSYPWFASAGYTRGLVNSIKAAKKLTLDDRDSLYKNRINPIATFSDTGTIIWGNKTLQVRESALDRLNIRRLLLQARKLISAVAVRLLFEQNDDLVRQEFLRLVNPILDSIKKERGLYDFRVSVSSAPEDIDNNQLTGKIYIKPTRSLEFIDLTFVITPTGASFDNV